MKIALIILAIAGGVPLLVLAYFGVQLLRALWEWFNGHG